MKNKEGIITEEQILIANGMHPVKPFKLFVNQDYYPAYYVEEHFMRKDKVKEAIESDWDKCRILKSIFEHEFILPEIKKKLKSENFIKIEVPATKKRVL